MQVKKCDVCRKKFEGKTNAKRCSETCRQVKQKEVQRLWGKANKVRRKYRQRERRAHPGVLLKECLICKKTFEGNTCAKTCSDKCRKLYKSQRSRDKSPTKICEICEKRFKGHGKALTCSSFCSKKLKDKRYREKHPRMVRACLECETPFHPHSRQITCSENCRRSHAATWSRSRLADPVINKRVNDQRRRWLQKPGNKEHRRLIKVKSVYGMTPVQQHNQWVMVQDRACACCGTMDPKKRDGSLFKNPWHWDHDHTCCKGHSCCGRCIRGRICANCNHILSWANDDPSKLGPMYVAYLEKGYIDLSAIDDMASPLGDMAAD